MIDFDVENLVGKFVPSLHGEQVRSFLGILAESFGRGGIEKVHKMTGVSRKTISRGIEECKNLERTPRFKPQQRRNDQEIIKSEKIQKEIEKAVNVAVREAIKRILGKMMPVLGEKARRLLLGICATCCGWGGKVFVAKLTKFSEMTVSEGQREVELMLSDPTARPASSEVMRNREDGGGRNSIVEKYPDIISRLEGILDGNTLGDPESPLRWTTKSLKNISEELKRSWNIEVDPSTIADLLKGMGFSLQQNKKKLGTANQHVDRNAQFKHINRQAKRHMEENQPVISVDTKKKELIGNYKNNGKEYCRKKQPIEVNDHDFGSERIAPYGIYDINNNEGYVNIGKSADTGAFAVNSIRTWWNTMGKERYPNATNLMITADGGGSNGSRNRLWKKSLQEFANETGLKIKVSHFPPGTSKWNKIEHRMFSEISKNWRGKPLETIETVVNLIANTTTAKGLKINCGTDETEYEKGIKVSEEDMEALNLIKNEWHGDWNYIILPNKTTLDANTNKNTADNNNSDTDKIKNEKSV